MKFEFLGRLRDKDTEDEEAQQQRPPVDEVRRLSDMGYSQEAIQDELRDQGYSHGAINQAINEAVRASAVDEGRRGGTQQPAPGQGQQPRQRQFETFDEAGGYEGGYAQESPPEYEEEEYGEETWSTDTGLPPEAEELIEVIVAEHFTDVEDEFDQVYTELDQLHDRVDALEDRVEELEIRRDEDESEILQRVNQMEQYFEESNERIGGMEKAFQQVLPSLVENVRELSTLVKDMKQERQ